MREFWYDPIGFIIAWWHKNENSIRLTISNFFVWLDRFENNIARLAAVGFLLCIVGHFCPELPERYPAIFGWFQGWLRFVEVAYEFTLRFIYTIISGESLVEFYTESQNITRQLIDEFVIWLSTL